jgi:hypothetical protein
MRPWRTPALVVLLAAIVGAGAVWLAPSEHDDDAASAATGHRRSTLPKGQPLTIVWGGDVTLGSSYGLPPAHARTMLSGVRRITRRADVAAVNLEGTFGTEGASKCPVPSPTCFAFQAPAENAAVLHEAGIDVVNLANNHAWDYGATGMGQTVTALRDHHVRLTGRPWEITSMKVGQARVAFVGFSAYRWTSPIRDLPTTQRIVRTAAARNNVVIVFMHAGAEGQSQIHTPDLDEQAFGEARGNTRAFAHAAIDAGADLVLGSGPHVLRGMEVYRDRLIAYSLGNLAGWHNFSLAGTAMTSALLEARVGRRGALLTGQLHSLRLVGAGVPAADPARRAAELVGAVSLQDFGTAGVQLSASGRIAAHSAGR